MASLKQIVKNVAIIGSGLMGSGIAQVILIREEYFIFTKD